MKPIVAAIAVICIFAVGWPSAPWANSKQEGLRLSREGQRLQEGARSREDLRKAVEVYERAVRVFEKIGDRRNAGPVYHWMGSIYSRWGEYAKAAEYYEKAYEIAKELGAPEGEAATLHSLGVVHEYWGQYVKAADFYEKSLALARRLGDSKGEAVNLNKLAGLYEREGQIKKAVDLYEKALSISRQIGDRKTEGGILANLGLVCAHQGQYDRATDFYEKALTVAREIGDLHTESATLDDLGSLQQNKGQYDKAVDFYEKALAIDRKMGNLKGEATTLSNMGIVYSAWGQYAKATELYDQSLGIKRKIGDRLGEGVTLNNVANVLHNQGEYAKALAFSEKGLAITREVGDLNHQAYCLATLGSSYWKWGQYADAMSFFEQALSIREKLGDLKNQAHDLQNLGVLNNTWGDQTAALKLLGRSLDMQRKIGDPRGAGSTLIHLGHICRDRGEYPQALKYYEETLALFSKMGISTSPPKHYIGCVYIDMGEIAKAESFLRETGFLDSLAWLSLVKGEYEQAKSYYEKWLTKTSRSEAISALFRIHTGLGMALEGMQDYRSAAEQYREAIKTVEEERSGLTADQREHFFDVRLVDFYRTDPYKGLARVLIKLNQLPEAWEASEYTKARLFSEAMSRRSEVIRVDVPQDVLQQDQDLNDRLTALKKKLQEAVGKANKLVIEALEPQIKELEVKLSDHIRMVRQKYPLFASTKYPEPMGLEQTAIKPDEWVLGYDVTDPGIIIYLTRGKELVRAFFKPIPRKELDALVLQFRNPLEIVPGKDNFDEKLKSFDLVAGKKLSDLLLSDILENLPKNIPLLIVPDDSLGTLPFEMLVLNDSGAIKTDKNLPYISGAEFFGDRNLISYSQSVTALTLSRIHAKAKGTEAGLLAIADPVFQERDERVAGAPKKEAPTGPFASLCKRLGLMAAENNPQMGGLKFSRLFLTGELAKTLAGLGKKNAKVCTGFEATKTNFLDTIAPQLTQYDEIVFATHGYFGKNLPGIMEPVLVLTLVPSGTDGFLRMTEVMGLNMNADIVALTACQTGLGKRTAGEGTMGMGRAFQYAGARSVLMSLWSVSEVASTKLVESFFRNLKEGKTKSEALVLARAQLRNGVWDHPFFWAGFILVGEVN